MNEEVEQALASEALLDRPYKVKRIFTFWYKLVFDDGGVELNLTNSVGYTNDVVNKQYKKNLEKIASVLNGARLLGANDMLQKIKSLDK